jgi:phosphoserine phosphatase
MKRALLFDLDDTLIVEEPAAREAFLATARHAATRRDLNPKALAGAARSRARELWYAAPTHPYCKRIGISSWEGLWCRFEGDDREVRALREWSPTYRREAWRLALADQGIEDATLAGELGEQFGVERRERHEVFADVADALATLRGTYSLALVTNGAACLQREKLAASGLGDHFEIVVISAELGVAKPEAPVFEHALERLGTPSAQTVMVGDSLARDVDGALAAGLGAIWVNRGSRPAPPDRTDLVEVSALSDLANALNSLEEARR